MVEVLFKIAVLFKTIRIYDILSESERTAHYLYNIFKIDVNVITVLQDECGFFRIMDCINNK